MDRLFVEPVHPSAAYGCFPGHDDASVLAGVLGVLLGRAASCEVTFGPGHQNTEAHCGLATVAPGEFSQAGVLVGVQAAGGHQAGPGHGGDEGPAGPACRV